jgi:hypothetical protein
VKYSTVRTSPSSSDAAGLHPSRSVGLVDVGSSADRVVGRQRVLFVRAAASGQFEHFGREFQHHELTRIAGVDRPVTSGGVFISRVNPSTKPST